MKKVILVLAIAMMFSCTENSRAKRFGGEAKLDVPCGQKVINITWKESELWYSTIPMEAGYVPVTHTFREESNFKIMEGSYLLIETKCK